MKLTDLIIARAMQKVAADNTGDTIASIVPASITGGFDQPLGSLMGYIGAPKTRAERDKMNTENTWRSALLPGVAGYRRTARRRSIASELAGGKGYAKPLSESWLAQITNKAIPAAAAAVNPVIGGALAAIPEAIAPLAAMVTKTRSKEEQQAYERSKGSTIANYLIPGVAQYNMWKSMGYGNRDAARAAAAKLSAE